MKLIDLVPMWAQTQFIAMETQIFGAWHVYITCKEDNPRNDALLLFAGGSCGVFLMLFTEFPLNLVFAFGSLLLYVFCVPPYIKWSRGVMKDGLGRVGEKH